MAKVLESFPAQEASELLVGFENPDDAAVYEIAGGIALVQTLDFFTPVVNDPFLFGKIAAANAFSDVYAMGGTPKTAMNIVCFPSCLKLEILIEILRGGREVATQAQVLIVGGHSIEDDEPKYGMAVTGLVDPLRITTIANARVGDTIILTKPVGFGILVTALKAEIVDEYQISEAISNAYVLNKAAAEIMLKYDVQACTDVTGFGLIGHLDEVMKASGTSCIVEAKAVPIYERAIELAAQGIIPEGAYRNKQYVGTQYHSGVTVGQEIQDALFDPQTSGGLLIFARQEDTESIVKELRLNQDVVCAEIIGEVRQAGSCRVRVA